MKQYKRPKIIYRCDPNKNTKCKKTSCFIFAGECQCTSDKKFAALDGYGKPIVDFIDTREESD